jgi:hypothetical protein
VGYGFKETAGAVLLIISVLTFTGCGKQGYLISVQTPIRLETAFHDTFRGGLTGNKVDILFVIDNSGSMKDNQALLSSSFASFIANFSMRELDFQIGVITTDTTSGCPGGYSCSGPSSLIYRPRQNAFLNNSTPNLITVFADTVRIGTGGSGAERGLHALDRALGPLNMIHAGSGTGFIRNDAFFHTVVLSDEDESCVLNVDTTDPAQCTLTFGSSANGSRRVAGALATSRVENAVNAIVGIKSGQRSQVRMDAILSRSDGIESSRGHSYERAVSELGGTIGDISSDFSSYLNDVGASVSGTVAGQYRLSQIPLRIEEMRVEINGVTMEPDETNGWTYSIDGNFVAFHGEALEVISGKEIRVFYTFESYYFE